MASFENMLAPVDREAPEFGLLTNERSSAANRQTNDRCLNTAQATVEKELPAVTITEKDSPQPTDNIPPSLVRRFEDGTKMQTDYGSDGKPSRISIETTSNGSVQLNNLGNGKIGSIAINKDNVRRETTFNTSFEALAEILNKLPQIKLHWNKSATGLNYSIDSGNRAQ